MCWRIDAAGKATIREKGIGKTRGLGFVPQARIASPVYGSGYG
jgi:hypothetical protein